MKTINGIKCTTNEYAVTAVFIQDGEPKTSKFLTNKRSAADVKKQVALNYNIKPSQVAVTFETRKHSFNVLCDYETFKNVLENAGIAIDEN